jgi:hypothetical protein
MNVGPNRQLYPLPVTDLTTTGVALRGVVTQLNEPVGREFVVDVARNIEGVLPDLDLASKYQLTAAGWAQMAANMPLHRLVEEELQRRVRFGTAPREEAQAYCAEAPAVLRGIMVDKLVAPGHRIEAIKGLQKTAGDQSPATNEKFSIHIDFGAGIKHDRSLPAYRDRLAAVPVRW